MTDGDGQAILTYTGTLTGTDSITASIVLSGQVFSSTPFYAIWTEPSVPDPTQRGYATTLGDVITFTTASSTNLVLEVPLGAVVSETQFAFRPSTSITGTPPNSFVFGGHAFTWFPVGFDSPFTFTQPITLMYTNTDVLTVDETTLNLYYFDGTTWRTEGITLVERDAALNRLVFTIAHLSDFALFGAPSSTGTRLYLPLILRDSTLSFPVKSSPPPTATPRHPPKRLYLFPRCRLPPRICRRPRPPPWPRPVGAPRGLMTGNQHTKENADN